MAFDGRGLIKRCNNQPDVGVTSGGRDFDEEARPGWSVWEDAVLLFGTTIGKQNKLRIHQVVALESC
jgi:hypothetical protein